MLMNVGASGPEMSLSGKNGVMQSQVGWVCRLYTGCTFLTIPIYSWVLRDGRIQSVGVPAAQEM